MYSKDPRQRRPMVRVGAMPSSSLLGAVLGITAVGFIITAAAVAFVPIPRGMSMFALLAGFLLIFGVRAARQNPSLQLGLFYGFTALEGLGLGPVISQYARVAGDQVVVNAAATTGVGMAVLAAIAYLSSFDFRRIQGIAMAGVVALVIISIINIFVRVVHPDVFSWATLIIFSGLTLVDFARIRAGGDGLTPVEMALQIYLDAINIFMALLEIFGVRRRG